MIRSDVALNWLKHVWTNLKNLLCSDWDWGSQPSPYPESSRHLRPVAMSMWSPHFSRFPSSNQIVCWFKQHSIATFHEHLVLNLALWLGSMQKRPLKLKGIFGSTVDLGYGHQYLVLCDAVACNECRRVHWKSLCVEMRQPSLFSKHTMILGYPRLGQGNYIMIIS